MNTKPDPNRFTGKVAFVTGAASGIGEAIARRLHAEGAAVVLFDCSDAPLRVVAEELGDRCRAVVGDVTDSTAVQSAIALVVDAFGGLDLAVNNAGTSADAAEVKDFDEATWSRIIDVNLTGVFRCLKHELAVMRPGASIVNVASVLGLVGYAESPAYVASKHAVVGLTKSCALENASRGIRINAIAPGFIATPMLAGVVTDDATSEVVARTPLARLGTPDEIAAFTSFLLSNDASFITGSAQLIDGGYSAA